MADDPLTPGAALRDDDHRRAAEPLPGDYGDPVAQVIAQAHRHGVYVHECPELVSLLMQVDLDAHMPPRLHDVIAELLLWIQEIDAEAARPSASKRR